MAVVGVARGESRGAAPPGIWERVSRAELSWLHLSGIVELAGRSEDVLRPVQR